MHYIRIVDMNFHLLGLSHGSEIGSYKILKFAVTIEGKHSSLAQL